VLLDTNVWAQLCDYEGRAKVRALYKLSRAHGVQIVVAPPVVYEVMARPPVSPSAMEALKERAWVLSRSWWHREPSDAYLEAGEVFGVVTRYRPEWLRRRRQDLLNFFADDWSKDYLSIPLALARELAGQDGIARELTKTRVGDRLRVPGFWKRLESNPGGFAHLMRDRQVELDRARSGVRAMRSDAPGLTVTVGRSEVPYWRAWSATTLPIALHEERRKPPGGRGLLDFLDPVIDLDEALTARKSWEALWLDDVKPDEVPHHWLRGTALPLQVASQITPGTPGDNQLVAYLFRTEHLATADKGLVRLVDDLAGCDPPYALARSHRVRQGTDTLEDVMTAIEGVGASPRPRS